VSRNKKGLHT